MASAVGLARRFVARRRARSAAGASIEVVRWPRVRIAVLCALGIALAGLYAAATWRISLGKYFPEPGQTLDYVKMLGDDASPYYLAFTTAALLLWLATVVLAWRTRGRLPRAVLFGFPVLFAAALLVMYPPQAVDMFHYHADARTLWIHGDNPLVTPPAAHEYPVGMSWQDQPSPYGPVWQLISALPTLPTQEHFLAGLIGFKVVGAASYLGCAWLIYRMVRRMRPGHETLALVLFAWNPFVLMRAVGNGHNDLVMMFFALRALDCAERRSWVLAFQALALSVLTKYVSALIAPPLLVFAWWQVGGPVLARVRALAPALGLAGVTTVVAFVPFWEGTDTFDTVRGEAGRMITSTPLLLRAVLHQVFGVGLDDSLRMAQRMAGVVFAMAYLPLVWQARRDSERLVVCCFTILFLYPLVAAAWFRPWYLLWPVAIAALRPRTLLGLVLVAISVSAPYADLIELRMLALSRTQNIEYLQTIALQVLPWALPPALVWLYGLVRYRSWHFDATRTPAATTPAAA